MSWWHRLCRSGGSEEAWASTGGGRVVPQGQDGWEAPAQGVGFLTASGLVCAPSWCTLITETAGSLKVPAPASRPKPRPSPSSTREPLLSSSENGNGGQEIPPADGRTERFLNALLPFCRSGPEGQLSSKALEKVLSLKRLMAEEDNGVGPPQEGEGVPGGGPQSSTRTQEMQEDLLDLEEIIKQIEEMEEEFCRLRIILSQLREITVPQPGCT